MSIPLKLLVASAAGMILGLGICGISVINSRAISAGTAAGVGLVIFGISCAGFAISVLILLGIGIARAFKK